MELDRAAVLNEVEPCPVDGALPQDASLPSIDAPLARLVGTSPSVRALRQRLPFVARASGAVLVHGASGTGKELIARLVHDLSPRSARAFVAVDCGALSEGVLESELFGHARGAFTGSAGERRGL